MSRLSKSIFVVALPIIFAVAFAWVANAQSIPGVTVPVALQVAPELPRPNSTATITAQSFSTDLDRATLSWYVNGKAFKKGIGMTEVSVPIGAAGSVTRVSVDVDTTDLGTVSDEISIRPADVTLIWETDGSIPLFYKGKSPETYGASFKVTAIPEFFTSAGKRIDPKTLIYTWNKNGSIVGDQSGYGKDSFSSIQESFLRDGDDVTVNVSTSDRTISTSRTVTITPTVGEVLFYESSPLYGTIFEKALSKNFSLDNEEITLRAETFGLSITGTASLEIDWTINGLSVPDFKGKKEITLRKTGEADGQTEIGLMIRHPSKILQGTQAGITIFQ